MRRNAKFVALMCAVLVVTATGCRIPLITPAVVGEWVLQAKCGEALPIYEDEEYTLTSVSWKLEANHTAVIVTTEEFGTETEVNAEYVSWTYSPTDHILVIGRDSFKVTFDNFWKTEMTLTEPDSMDPDDEEVDPDDLCATLGMQFTRN